MSSNFDVIIVGSGPAGVSSAFPLVEAGLKVLMIDGGKKLDLDPPVEAYLTSRMTDEFQWKWMIGTDFHSLKNVDANSPKLRVPIHAPIFDGFSSENKIKSSNFVSIGSLASGGLSNAWGCGVACLSSTELSAFPCLPSEIVHSYEVITRRIGVSGAQQDDLSDYFGLDSWSDSPIQLDSLHSRLLAGYIKRRSEMSKIGIRIGRSRVAALSRDTGERKSCNLSGNCLWGCSRRSLYSALEDLEILKKYPNFTYCSGFVVDRIGKLENLNTIEGKIASNFCTLIAKKIILAAGTLASTRIALDVIGLARTVTMRTCPTAAFLLWLPQAMGSVRTNSFGLGQLSFALTMPGEVSGFGSLFNPTGIPMAEFSRYLPFGKRSGIDFLKNFLNSCVAGNIFLPGHLSTTALNLSADKVMNVEGRYQDEVKELMRFGENRLRKAFWKLGAWLLPKSFTVGRPGGDIHYACSLPMRAIPHLGETSVFGELFGGDGIYVVDGASLPILTEKSHTLTIMANADRIARHLAIKLKASS